MTVDPEACNFFWGSHGCDLPADGHRLHRCGLLEPAKEQLELVASDDFDPLVLGPCCEYDEDADPKARVRFYYDNEDGAWYPGPWTEYGEGWRP